MRVKMLKPEISGTGFEDGRYPCRVIDLSSLPFFSTENGHGEQGLTVRQVIRPLRVR